MSVSEILNADGKLNANLLSLNVGVLNSGLRINNNTPSGYLQLLGAGVETNHSLPLNSAALTSVQGTGYFVPVMLGYTLPLDFNNFNQSFSFDPFVFGYDGVQYPACLFKLKVMGGVALGTGYTATDLDQRPFYYCFEVVAGGVITRTTPKCVNINMSDPAISSVIEFSDVLQVNTSTVVDSDLVQINLLFNADGEILNSKAQFYMVDAGVTATATGAISQSKIPWSLSCSVVPNLGN